ncbi:MAG: NTP transferase domain-containing protein [Candidatus Margulisbacteria bacterium]|nr:NTP transferase domain-containing protein [Candidatus Margulisiibacteriota bacterium]MBU1617132.1 NTP transferase domain-containing protein [Candidatus Margulisiibacteriota bacterium]
MLNLIPMAGGGKRFQEVGFRGPKPMVPVLGQPMVITASRSFPRADRWIFICNSEHLQRYPLKQVLLDNFSSTAMEVGIITVDQITQGQACTCLLAEDRMRPDEALFISSCDYQVVYDHPAYQRLLDDPTVDVIIWTFKNPLAVKKNPLAYAYCRVKDGRVVEVVEKKTVSDQPEKDPAVVGSFYFRRSEAFLAGAKKMIVKNIRVNNEFYVGTSINQLIEDGKKVVVFEVERFISFGTPFELKLFQYWEEYFDRLEDFDYAAQYSKYGKVKW